MDIAEAIIITRNGDVYQGIITGMAEGFIYLQRPDETPRAFHMQTEIRSVTVLW